MHIYHVIENCQLYEIKRKTNGSPILATQTVSITKMLSENTHIRVYKKWMHEIHKYTFAV